MTPQLSSPDDEVRPIFDQLERRARAARRRAFDDADLWPSVTDHQTICCEQVVRGHDLRRTLVAPIVGDEIGSTTALYVIADAYELGVNMTELVGGSATQGVELGKLCAMFALSCSLFDTLQLSHLTELLEVVTHHRSFAERAATELDSDLRLTLKAIAWTLDRLQSLIAATGGTDSPIAIALTAALRAELRARVSDTGSEWTFVETARARFELPFTVLREAILAATQTSAIDTRLDEIFNALAAICFRTTDLTELVTALRGGGLNSIAAVAGATPTRTPNAAKVRVIAARLAKLDVIESAGHQLWASASRAMQLIATLPRLRAVLASYARRSIE
jgi:hypothetical protein